jgi:PII-like signaling protein
MDMHVKKRLELIIERPAYKRACRVLVEAGATGYTVLPALAGYGGGNKWERGTDLSASNDMVVISSIMDQKIVNACTDALSKLLGSHIGVLSFSDVTVMRPDRF